MKALLQAMIVLATFALSSISHAGAAGPFEICRNVQAIDLSETTNLVRNGTQVFRAMLTLFEEQCTLENKITGYKYQIVLDVFTGTPGILKAGLGDSSPIVVTGGLFFKDGSPANLMRSVRTLEAAHGLASKFETRYTAIVHETSRFATRLGIDNFADSISGFSFSIVSDDIPTTVLSSN